MTKKNLHELITMCEEECAAITDVNVGSVNSFSTPLVDIMQRELVTFAVYITMSNGISDEEFKIIRAYLNFDNLSDAQLRQKLNSYRPAPAFEKSMPVTIKYFVLADAGKKIPRDPTHYQAAQILLDVYKILGQAFIALHDGDVVKSSKNLAAYTSMIEKFLKEYGVYYVGTRKFIVPSYEIDVNGAYAGGSPKKAPKATTKKNDYRIYKNDPQKAAEKAEEIKQAKEEEAEEEKEFDVDEVLAELNSYVGLESVKQEVESLVNLIKVQKMRAELGIKTTEISNHMVFMGNPGTGKTTVARIVSKIYHGLGVLPTNKYIEVDRGGLVCGYVGQTATRTQEVVDEAMGGVLFIDEAYALTVNKGENDFGQEAVDTLLKAMEDHRDDLVVIVAGYTGPMNEFLSSNPGLRSRFNKFLYFEDYTPEELVQILEGMAAKKQYELTAPARKQALKYFEDRVAQHVENFANAREARNYLEKAITNQAGRVVKLTKPTKKDLMALVKEDLPEKLDEKKE